MKRSLQTLLKLAVACGILAFLLHRAESDKVWTQLQSVRLGTLLLCLLLATGANLLAAGRMRFFMRTIGIALSRRYAIKLSYVGTLFNLVLPTGVGGDAVKAWAIRREHSLPLASIIKALVLDRASGLFIVCLIVLGWFLLPGRAVPFAWLAWLGLPMVTVSYFYLAALFFGQRPVDGVQSLGYSICSQALWCAIIIVLCQSSGDAASTSAYVMLYAVASIVIMLPITIGGLGLREMTFYTGSHLLQHYAGLSVDAERGIAIALTLFAIYIVSALPGLLWSASLAPRKHIDK